MIDPTEPVILPIEKQRSDPFKYYILRMAKIAKV